MGERREAGLCVFEKRSCQSEFDVVSCLLIFPLFFSSYYACSVSNFSAIFFPLFYNNKM